MDTEMSRDTIDSLLSSDTAWFQTSKGPEEVDVANATSITILTLDKFGNADEAITPVTIQRDETASEYIPVEETPELNAVTNDRVISDEEQEYQIEIPVVTLVDEKETKVAEEYTDNKIQEKFQSFREKFLDRETQADTWENTIIEKQDRRIQSLKRFADVLDNENVVLEGFIADKLGS